MSDRLSRLKTVLWALVGVLGAVSVIRFTYGLGAVTNLSDAAPWGLWIGFDVMSGVALAAGGFVLAATVHIFRLERYRPFVRAAILTALIGYAAVAVGLLYDLGLPWRIWHPLVHWQIHSVLFEVAMCVMLYLTVLALEFAPVVLEHPRFDRPVFRRILRGLRRVTIPLVIAGIVLSTLHQSSLGSLFLIMPDRLHPLWYSHGIYLQFFISAVGLGLATVVLEALFSRWFLGHQVHAREIGGLGLAASLVLWLYLAIRLGDLAARGVLGTALDGSWQARLFLFEIALSAAVPATLLLFPAVRRRMAWVGVAAAMIVAGLIGHRLDVSIVAFARPAGLAYFPTWEEVAVSLGIVAGAMLIFLFFVERFRVFDDVQGLAPPPEPSWEAASTRTLRAPAAALPRRYSLAALGGAAAALLFLPLGGPSAPDWPVTAPRRVEGVVTRPDSAGTPVVELAGAGVAATLLLVIDGNRAGELALFDHAAHQARLGDGACATCHHLDLPLDRGTSCSRCHRDMYAATPLFDHPLHEDALGGTDGCGQCHAGAAVRSFEAATACSECHAAAEGARIPAPEPHWRDAASYMDAMHGLCVSCHGTAAGDAPEEHAAELGACRTCHDPDRREELRRLQPRREADAGTAEDATAAAVAPVTTAAVVPPAGAGGE